MESRLNKKLFKNKFKFKLWQLKRRITCQYSDYNDILVVVFCIRIPLK